MLAQQDSSLPLRMTGPWWFSWRGGDSSLRLRMTVALGLKLFEFGDPELDFGVGGHPEIASG